MVPSDAWLSSVPPSTSSSPRLACAQQTLPPALTLPRPQTSVSLPTRSKFYWKMGRQSLQGSPHSKMFFWELFFNSSSKSDTKSTLMTWSSRSLGDLYFHQWAVFSGSKHQTSLSITFEGCLGGNRNLMMNLIKWVHLAIELHYYHDHITHFILKFMFIFRTNSPFCSLHSKAVHIFYV